MPGWSYTSPPGWAATIRRILTRDQHICYICGQPGANRVDHVTPVAEGGSHHDDNLRAIHQEPCHREKTRAEIARGNRRKPQARRRPEQHPGLR